MRQPKIKLENFQSDPGLSEVRLVYRSKHKPTIRVLKSKDAFDILTPLYDKDLIEYLETFYLLLLNRANLVLGWVLLSQGGTAGTVVDTKVVFSLALTTNAHSIILCHNHPSGNLTPSEADIKLTKEIKKAGDILDLKLLDHLIVSNDDIFFSFSDEGII